MAIQGPHFHLAKIFWTSERGPLLDRAHTLHFATLFITHLCQDTLPASAPVTCPGP